MPYMTYDFTFQIWKHKSKDEYWAYDENCRKFVKARLVALEIFGADEDELKLICKHDSDWCGEVDGAYDSITETSVYGWFEKIKL